MKVVFFLFILISGAQAHTHKTSVWVDYDISINEYIRDVDDGYALMHALLSDELQVEGISTIFGNINNHNKMIRKTERVLKLFHRESIPVFRGASGPEELGTKTDAYEGLVSVLEKKSITILAMGRLTNIATLIRLRPDLLSNIKQIVVMAGRMKEYNVSMGGLGVVFSDTNIDGDVESTKVIVKSKVPLVMIPTESMVDELVLSTHLREMSEAGGALKWMARRSYLWKFIWRIYPRLPGFIPWDVYLVSYLTHPDDFSCHEKIPTAMVWMKDDTSYTGRGSNRSTESKFFLASSYELDSKNLATYCYKIKPGHINSLVDFWIEKLK